jgi:hypothetical protein
MELEYPASWANLEFPWVRDELILYLEELADPAATAKWLNPDPKGPIIGIDQTFHFFFDDREFGPHSVGWTLFDLEEVAAISKVTVELDSILQTNRKGDDRYFLSHPRWPKVASAAAQARELLAGKGLPVFR